MKKSNDSEPGVHPCYEYVPFSRFVWMPFDAPRASLDVYDGERHERLACVEESDGGVVAKSFFFFKIIYQIVVRMDNQ